MKFPVLSLLALVALAASSADAKKVPAGAKVLQRAENRFIVQFDQPAGATVKASVQSAAVAKASAQHHTFRTFMAQKKIDVKVDKTFRKVVNAAAVTLTNPKDVHALASAPGVKAVFPIVHHKQSAPVALRNGLEFAKRAVPGDQKLTRFQHKLTNMDKVKTDLGLTGEGVFVAVVDTGIDYLHPAFSVPGQTCTEFKGPGCRVQFGRDFVGDAYDSAGKKGSPTAVPDADPMDCGGHGTHCAGIIGGLDDQIEGVAPGVVLGAYKVFGCEGSTDTPQILDAMEAAYEDGAHVISMSLGGGVVGQDYIEAQAVTNLSNAGIYVAIAASNDGDKGYDTVAAPSVAAGALSIASFDNTNQPSAAAIITGVAGVTAPAIAIGSNAKFTPEQAFPIIASNVAIDSLVDGCLVNGASPFKPDQFKGGAALIRRGTCAFTEKAQNAAAAGASAVIIRNRLPEYLAAGAVDATVTIPVAFIGGTDGDALFKAATAGKTTFAVSKNQAVIPIATAGQPSDFSSWGLDVNLFIKPEVAAPGGMIYSSVPRSHGSYDVFSGTSMATPYIAGTIALHVQKNGPSQGDASFQNLRARLQNTARPSAVPGNVAGSVESVAKIGAGLLDAYAFLTNDVAVTPSAIALGDNPAWPKGPKKTETITITNSGKIAKTYTLKHTPSRSILGEGNRLTADFVYADNHARVTFSQQTVTVQPGSSTKVTVTFDNNTPVIGSGLPAKGHWVYSGFVTLQTADQKSNLVVPYATMLGDFKTFQVLPTDADKDLVALADGDADTNPNALIYDGTTPAPVFDLSSIHSSPAVVLATYYPVRHIAIALQQADTKKTVGYVLAMEFFERLPQTVVPFQNYTLTTSATEVPVTIPDGDYVAAIQYIKPKSLTLSKDIVADLETAWTSTKFTIKKQVAAPAPAPAPVVPHVVPGGVAAAAKKANQRTSPVVAPSNQ
ncbi:peptidase S8/S53 domain-containing protein [Blastocladiella britannica]|nr:peptidase S8/S53 domain-containing protein [Blastocladiella britannica]